MSLSLGLHNKISLNLPHIMNAEMAPQLSIYCACIADLLYNMQAKPVMLTPPSDTGVLVLETERPPSSSPHFSQPCQPCQPCRVVFTTVQTVQYVIPPRRPHPRFMP
jgi:hypothetical protein